MKRICILIVGLVITSNGSTLAQDDMTTVEKDTTVTTLKEIVVEGRSQRIIQDGIEYTPDKNTKRLSADAMGLLSNMLIPNLKIESENTITTNFGEEVKIFIDYIPADKKEISGLNTQDVLRVEVLDYPADARFNQAEHVVNFIMKKYQWGGYTKLMLSGRILTDEMVLGNLYQKFSYKNWVFDLAASGSGEWCHNYRNFQQENFKDIFYGNNHFDNISKTSSTDRFKERSNSEGVSFRFGYGQDNYVISHTISFDNYAIPESTTDSHVDFSDTFFNASSSSEYNNFKLWNTYINGYYYFNLPKDNSLQANWTAGFQSYNSYSEYILEDTAPITTNTKTAFSFFSLDVNYVKKFANNHTLGLRLFSNNNNWNTTYEDEADGNQKQLNSTQTITAEYRKQWDFELNLMVRAGTSYHLMRENGRNNLHQWSPYLHARINYSVNPKNRISVSGALYDSDVLPDMTADLRIRKNEMMWIEGNPLLRNPKFRWVSAEYTFIPSNIFFMSANIMYRNNRHVTVYDYYTEDGFDGIIRSVNDNNTLQRLEGYISMGVNLFKRTLAISGSIEGVREILTGSRSMTNNILTGTLSARWNYRNISLKMFYWFPATIIYNQMGSRLRQPQQYGLSATYRIGNLLASLQFNNWFSQGKRRQCYDSVHYDNVSWSWSRKNSRLLSISLQYTFNYGKKVSHDDELTLPSGGGGGILK